MARSYVDFPSWDGSDHQDYASWAEAVTLRNGADDLTVVAGETAYAPVVTSDIVPKSATDTLDVVAADTATAPLAIVPIGGGYLDPASWITGLYRDPVSWGEGTGVSASDTLVPGVAESYTLSGTGPVERVAADTLVVQCNEAPTAARLTSTDDAVVLASGETAVSPASQTKSASDALVPGIGESFVLSAGGFLTKVGSDTLQVAVGDTSQPIAVIVGLFASDPLVPAIADSTVELVTPLAKSASDALVVAVAETSLIAAHDAPAGGLLPPGWVEYEEEELTGIAHPWRVEPRNITPHQGWFKRKYWAIDDETGRRRVTDRWRNAARAQAWTQYHSGKQSAAA